MANDKIIKVDGFARNEFKHIFYARDIWNSREKVYNWINLFQKRCMERLERENFEHII